MISYAKWGNELYTGERSYNIVGRQKMWLTTGLVLVVLSVVLIIFPGLSPSIDFKGGSEFSVSNVKNIDLKPARDVVKRMDQMKGAKVTTLGSTGIRVQTDPMTTAKSREVVSELAKAYEVKESDVASTQIGPSWGRDVTRQAIWSLVIFFILVGIMLTLYFRTWTMAAAALFALSHDVLLTSAAFAITGVEVSPATIIGVLTILAYSLYDTVVVFDKVRELTTDFENQTRYTFGELVNLSVNQTMVRSINTSVVAILPIGSILFVSLFVLGGGTLRDISMALFIGTIVGTWSSLFIASTSLVWLRSKTKKVHSHNELVAARRAKAEDGKSPKNDDGDVNSDVKARIAKPVKPGQHLGRAAQPKRKSRSKR